MMKIPNQRFDLNLGITKINFELNDIEFQYFSVNEVIGVFNDDDRLRLGVDGINMLMTLSWSFQQQSYPYLRDGGTGRLEIRNASARSVMQQRANDPECPNRYKTEIEDGDFRIRGLKLSLDGGQSWIYQSMINLILEAVEGSMSNQFSALMLQVVKVLLADSQDTDPKGMAYEAPYNDIWKDDRDIGFVRVGAEFKTSFGSGRIFHVDHLDDEYVSPVSQIQKTLNKNNFELSYAISEASFQNFFYIFHKYHNLFSGPEFQTQKVPLVTILNAAVLVEATVLINGTQIEAKLRGEPKLRWVTLYLPRKNHQNVTENATYVFFEFKPYDNMFPHEEEGLQSIIAEHYSAVLKKTGYQISSTPYMDIEQLKVYLDGREKVLRVAGNNGECPHV